jgi:hypothetical protein
MADCRFGRSGVRHSCFDHLVYEIPCKRGVVGRLPNPIALGAFLVFLETASNGSAKFLDPRHRFHPAVADIGVKVLALCTHANVALGF